MIVQPSDELYAKHSVVATNGIVHVEPNIPFRILVANFGTTPKRLVKFAEVLGLVNSDTEKTRPEPAMKTCAPKPFNPEEYTAKTMRKTTVQILFRNTRLTS